MDLNLLPCYQVVYCNRKYFLSQWDICQKTYVCCLETEEKPEIAGNFLIFHLPDSSLPGKKLYGLWCVNDTEGYCIGDKNILFDHWYKLEGHFLCTCLENRNELVGENEAPQWYLIRQNQMTLEKIVLGQALGNPRFRCFVNTSETENETCLSFFQRGILQRIKIDRLQIDEQGYIWYQIENLVYGIEEYPLPDGGSNWRFKPFSDKEWNEFRD